MKYFISISFLLSILIASCAEKVDIVKVKAPILYDILVEIPDTSVDKSLLQYDNKTSSWTLNDQLYSGYALSYYHNDILSEKTGFLKGRKQNQSTLWFPDKHLKRITNYHNGKLHGVKKSWSSDENHVLVSQLNYHKGKANGEQKFWYVSGEVYKILNLNMGKEEGLQKAFRKNGELYANYEAKEGRVFGLRKAALCYGLEDGNM